MDFVIEKFFALHHYLALPGIGNFKTGVIPADLDFINRSITSSKNRIVFNTLSQTPTQIFYSFLAHELQTNQAQAENSFADYIHQLQQQIAQTGSINFKTIGTITKQQNDVLTFQPEAIPEYFPQLVAEKIIRKNVAHTVRVGEQQKSSQEMHAVLNEPVIVIKKEKWWVAASILAFIGIAAIVFYYASH